MTLLPSNGTKQVLFLCSANYYRSRFAEHMFNWLATEAGLAWRADSRGLMVGHWGDIGPIARATLEALRERGVAIDRQHRLPISLAASDLDRSDLVVAVKESEHRPLLREHFPDWVDTVEYWHIDDLDCAAPADALPLLEERVRALVDRLGS
jgi:protein-tyrosine phosphatase